jgi:DNA polymerase-3 subunit chi
VTGVVEEPVPGAGPGAGGEAAGERPRVDFYVVADASPGAATLTACRLAEKAWHAGHRVYLQAPSAEAIARVDEALWTFRPDSFVPHGRYPEQAGEDLPVLIGWGGDPGGFGDVLINLAAEVPTFHARFARVLEVVAGDPEGRAAARGRFRFYQQGGYPLHSHDL